MIKFVAYSPPGKIMFSTSSAGTPALLIEPQSASNARLGRGLDLDVLHCRNKYSNGPENATNYAFRNPKIGKFSGMGALPRTLLHTSYLAPYAPLNTDPGSSHISGSSVFQVSWLKQEVHEERRALTLSVPVIDRNRSV